MFEILCFFLWHERTFSTDFFAWIIRQQAYSLFIISSLLWVSHFHMYRGIVCNVFHDCWTFFLVPSPVPWILYDHQSDSFLSTLYVLYLALVNHSYAICTECSIWTHTRGLSACPVRLFQFVMERNKCYKNTIIGSFIKIHRHIPGFIEAGK